MAIDPGATLKALREALTSPRTSGFVLLVAALALGLPQPAADFLGIAGLREQFRPWLGVAVLVSLSAQAIVGIGAADGWRERRGKTRRLLAELRSLSPKEKALLRRYIAKKTTTLYFGLQDGVATGLQARGVLYCPSSMGSVLTGFAFNLQPWAWEELQKHPELLAPSDGDPPEDGDDEESETPFAAMRRRGRTRI